MPGFLRRLIGTLAALAALLILGVAAVKGQRALRAARICPRPVAEPSTAAGPLPPAATTGLLLVANQKSASASIVDLSTGAVVHVPAGVEPHDADVSPDGRWGVVSDYGRKVDGNKLVVIDMAAKRVARVIDLGEYRGAHDVAFLPGISNRVVVTTQGSRHVVEVDLEKGGVVAAIETRGEASHSLALARDGRTLFTSNEESASLSRLDLATRAFVRHYSVGPRPEGLDITPDGREIWTGSREGERVRVLDAATGAVRATFPGFATPDRIAISPDGRRAAIADWGCNAVHLADVPGRRVIGAITGLDRPHAVEFAPDNRVAFVTFGRRKGSVAVVDLETRRVLARHTVGETPDGLGWGPVPR